MAWVEKPPDQRSLQLPGLQAVGPGMLLSCGPVHLIDRKLWPFVGAQSHLGRDFDAEGRWVGMGMGDSIQGGHYVPVWANPQLIP